MCIPTPVAVSFLACDGNGGRKQVGRCWLVARVWLRACAYDHLMECGDDCVLCGVNIWSL